MDPEVFEKWMDGVIPRIAELSEQQTDTFFLQLTQHCTIERRLFLQECFADLFCRDFMTLPDVVYNTLLKFLNVKDILNLRLVCRAWKEKINTDSLLWTVQAEKCPFLSDDCLHRPPQSASDAFELFMQSQRVLSQMKSRKAFCIRTFHLNSCRRYSIAPQLIAYSPDSKICVTVAKRRDTTLYATDTTTERILWSVRTTTGYSCLHITSDLILLGNHFGQVSVLTLRNGRPLALDMQCGASSVVSLDVDRSGRFMAVVTYEGCLHLVDSQLDVTNISVDLPPDVGIEMCQMKVFFVPDTGLPPGQLALCLCADRWLWVAVVVGETGRVLHRDVHVFTVPVLSFTRSSAEPNMLFSTSKDFFCSPPTHQYFLQHQLHVSPSGVHIMVTRITHPPVLESHQLENRYDRPMSHIAVRQVPDIDKLCLFSYPPEDLYLMAAGRELGVAVIATHLIIFRLKCGTILTAYRFLDTSITLMVCTRETGRLLAVNAGGWLDGLSPWSMRADQPLVMLGSEPGFVQALCWSPNLWGNVSSRAAGRDVDTSQVDTSSGGSRFITGDPPSQFNEEDSSSVAACEDVSSFPSVSNVQEEEENSAVAAMAVCEDATSLLTDSHVKDMKEEGSSVGAASDVYDSGSSLQTDRSSSAEVTASQNSDTSSLPDCQGQSEPMVKENTSPSHRNVPTLGVWGNAALFEQMITTHHDARIVHG